VESFGMHLRADGTTLVGTKVESLMGTGAGHVSLDMLSRLLVDLHQDSSLMMNDLLSPYQKAALSSLFSGDEDNRSKFNLVIAERITPFLQAEEYKDADDNENELKQILGDVQDAHDLGEDCVLVMGRDGMLVAGASARSFEPLLVAFLSLLVREQLLRTLFVRVFVLEDALKKARALVRLQHTDPNHLARLRQLLNDASLDAVLLKELAEFVRESLSDGGGLPQRPPAGNAVAQKLFDLLAMEQQHKDVVVRAQDIQKLVVGAGSELGHLQRMVDALNTAALGDVCSAVEGHTGGALRSGCVVPCVCVCRFIARLLRSLAFSALSHSPLSRTVRSLALSALSPTVPTRDAARCRQDRPVRARSPGGAAAAGGLFRFRHR
jgi:hypothetical protein